MPIFLDSTNVGEIEKYHRMGIIRGVTTNPSIMVKDGVTGGMSGIEARAKEIARVIAPLPISVEVITNDAYKMLDQAKTFASWADNINVKVTVHGPEGELENLEVVHKLETVVHVRSTGVELILDWRLLFRPPKDPGLHCETERALEKRTS